MRLSKNLLITIVVFASTILTGSLFQVPTILWLRNVILILCPSHFKVMTPSLWYFHPGEKVLTVFPIYASHNWICFYQVAPQPLAIQRKQYKPVQPLLVANTPQSTPPLHPLQSLHILPVWEWPELDSILQMRPHHSPTKLHHYFQTLIHNVPNNEGKRTVCLDHTIHLCCHSGSYRCGPQKREWKRDMVK